MHTYRFALNTFHNCIVLTNFFFLLISILKTFLCEYIQLDQFSLEFNKPYRPHHETNHTDGRSYY